MEGRMTLCNMSIEAGARAGMIAPDKKTFEYFLRDFLLKFWNFHFSSTFPKIFSPKKNWSRKIFPDFFEIFYLDFFCMFFFLYQSEIFSGIQKSYLENRASIIKLFKIKIPIFLTQILGFPYTSVQCYVHRPLSHWKVIFSRHCFLLKPRFLREK